MTNKALSSHEMTKGGERDGDKEEVRQEEVLKEFGLSGVGMTHEEAARLVFRLCMQAIHEFSSSEDEGIADVNQAFAVLGISTDGEKMTNDQRGGDQHEEENRKEKMIIDLRRKLKGSYTELRLAVESLDKFMGK